MPQLSHLSLDRPHREGADLIQLFQQNNLKQVKLTDRDQQKKDPWLIWEGSFLELTIHRIDLQPVVEGIPRTVKKVTLTASHGWLSELKRSDFQKLLALEELQLVVGRKNDNTQSTISKRENRLTINKGLLPNSLLEALPMYGGTLVDCVLTDQDNLFRKVLHIQPLQATNLKVGVHHFSSIIHKNKRLTIVVERLVSGDVAQAIANIDGVEQVVIEIEREIGAEAFKWLMTIPDLQVSWKDGYRINRQGGFLHISRYTVSEEMAKTIAQADGVKQVVIKSEVQIRAEALEWLVEVPELQVTTQEDSSSIKLQKGVLTISGYTITGGIVAMIVGTGNSIEKVVIETESAITDWVLAWLVKVSELQVTGKDGCSMTRQGGMLHISRYTVTEGMAEAIVKARGIKKVVVEGESEIGSEALAQLVKVSDLQVTGKDRCRMTRKEGVLTISGYTITEGMAEAIACDSKIEKVVIGTQSEIGAEALAWLVDVPDLQVTGKDGCSMTRQGEVLHISGYTITGEIVNGIVDGQILIKQVVIETESAITGWALAWLVEVPELQVTGKDGCRMTRKEGVLTISGYTVTAEMAGAIAVKARGIKKVVVEGKSLIEKSAVAHLMQVKEYEVKDCYYLNRKSVISLDVDFFDIQTACLTQDLVELINQTKLLQNVRILGVEKNFALLAQLSSQQNYLQLWDCLITQEAVDALTEAACTLKRLGLICCPSLGGLNLQNLKIETLELANNEGAYPDTFPQALEVLTLGKDYKKGDSAIERLQKERSSRLAVRYTPDANELGDEDEEKE